MMWTGRRRWWHRRRAPATVGTCPFGRFDVGFESEIERTTAPPVRHHRGCLASRRRRGSPPPPPFRRPRKPTRTYSACLSCGVCGVLRDEWDDRANGYSAFLVLFSFWWSKTLRVNKRRRGPFFAAPASAGRGSIRFLNHESRSKSSRLKARLHFLFLRSMGSDTEAIGEN